MGRELLLPPPTPDQTGRHERHSEPATVKELRTLFWKVVGVVVGAGILAVGGAAAATYLSTRDLTRDMVDVQSDVAEMASERSMREALSNHQQIGHPDRAKLVNDIDRRLLVIETKLGIDDAYRRRVLREHREEAQEDEP